MHRCLVACLRFLAKCPCPACLVKKEDMPNMGTVNDMKFRERNQRKDDQPVHYDIASARRKIFEDGAAPEGKTVEAILGPTSITPSRVRCQDIWDICCRLTSLCIRVHSPPSLHSSG